MLKNILIIFLILLVIGLYFAPSITKGIIKATGKATMVATKNVWNEVKESEEMMNLTEEAKDRLKNMGGE